MATMLQTSSGGGGIKASGAVTDGALCVFDWTTGKLVKAATNWAIDIGGALVGKQLIFEDEPSIAQWPAVGGFKLRSYDDSGTQRLAAMNSSGDVVTLMDDAGNMGLGIGQKVIFDADGGSDTFIVASLTDRIDVYVNGTSRFRVDTDGVGPNQHFAPISNGAHRLGWVANLWSDFYQAGFHHKKTLLADAATPSTGAVRSYLYDDGAGNLETRQIFDTGNIATIASDGGVIGGATEAVFAGGSLIKDGVYFILSSTGSTVNGVEVRDATTFRPSTGGLKLGQVSNRWGDSYFGGALDLAETTLPSTPASGSFRAYAYDDSVTDFRVIFDGDEVATVARQGFDLPSQIPHAVTTHTANATIANNDEVQAVDSTTAAFTLTLPPCYEGAHFTVPDCTGNCTANPVTIAPDSGGSDAIGGAPTSLKIDADWGGVQLEGYDATTWLVVGGGGYTKA